MRVHHDDARDGARRETVLRQQVHGRDPRGDEHRGPARVHLLSVRAGEVRVDVRGERRLGRDGREVEPRRALLRVRRADDEDRAGGAVRHRPRRRVVDVVAFAVAEEALERLSPVRERPREDARGVTRANQAREHLGQPEPLREDGQAVARDELVHDGALELEEVAPWGRGGRFGVGVLLRRRHRSRRAALASARANNARDRALCSSRQQSRRSEQIKRLAAAVAVRTRDGDDRSRS
eukprot:9882-Pelagococcus_subviridis.AAC.1